MAPFHTCLTIGANMVLHLLPKELQWTQWNLQVFELRKNDPVVTLITVRPVKSCQMSIKVAQKDLARKMKDFDTFTNIA